MEKYLNMLNEVMKKYDLEGGFLHATYERGINTGDFNCCYVDSRVKSGNKLRKDLAIILDKYFEEFPEAVRPLYSYK